jgi:hypothetical protein
MTSKEVLKKYEQWQQLQAAQKAAAEALPEIQRELRLARESKERAQARADAASVKKNAAERARKKARKKLMREPNAWRAASKALSKMPEGLTKRTGVTAAAYAYSAYSAANGKMTYDEWLAHLAEIYQRQRERDAAKRRSEP